MGFINLGKTFLATLMVAQTAIGMGLFISTCAENMVTASAIAPALTMPMVMFGGLFANSGTLPVWIVWVQYISPIYYGNIALSSA